MTTDNIQALGNLLGTYRSDLTYIRDFHRHKKGLLSSTEYLKKTTGTFKSFLNGFRVARNVDKNKTDVLLRLTIEWISQKCADNVDDFADALKQNGITHGKLMTSLASKILFLNNPWVILPLDKLAKQAVGLHNNNYSQYFPLTIDFKMKNQKEIQTCLASVDRHLSIIEIEFKNEIENLTTIRLNRFVDKILWTIGRKNKT